jgi:hypothetical protein
MPEITSQWSSLSLHLWKLAKNIQYLSHESKFQPIYCMCMEFLL